MRLSAKEFRDWTHKSITLLGMSGVGKTCLAHVLRRHNWFHYSIDYRIGTRYLDEAILDNIKLQAMQIPSCATCCARTPFTSATTHRGQSQARVELSRQAGQPRGKGASTSWNSSAARPCTGTAEIEALKDSSGLYRKGPRDLRLHRTSSMMPAAACASWTTPRCIQTLDEHTLILYIKATEADAQELIHRAEEDPKPLYYRDEFLDEQLESYKRERGIEYVALDRSGRLRALGLPAPVLFPPAALQSIAERYGYTVTTTELAQVKNERRLSGVGEKALDRPPLS